MTVDFTLPFTLLRATLLASSLPEIEDDSTREEFPYLSVFTLDTRGKFFHERQSVSS